MKLSKVIKQLSEMYAQHGDLDCFDANFRTLCDIHLREPLPGTFPSDWYMPDVFVQFGEED